jgi:hypothetical protein
MSTVEYTAVDTWSGLTALDPFVSARFAAKGPRFRSDLVDCVPRDRRGHLEAEGGDRLRLQPVVASVRGDGIVGGGMPVLSQMRRTRTPCFGVSRRLARFW